MILNVGDRVEMKLPNSRGMKISCHILAIVKDPDDASEEGNMIVFRYWGNNKKTMVLGSAAILGTGNV